VLTRPLRSPTEMISVRRVLPPFALAAAVMAFPAAALAGQHRPQPLVKVQPLTTQVNDRVITGHGIRARAASSPYRAYQTADGTRIQIRFDASYLADPAVAQTYVDYLDSLPHGTELGKLKLLLAPPDQVTAECGGTEGVLACYDGQTHEMVVPGEQITSQSGVSTSYVVAHEYGHHVATYRDNAPFPSLDWGPKRWASYKLICNYVLAGRLAPGAEGEYYRANPGEGWAETYARLTYPNEPWRFAELLKPDAAALEAAKQDVLDPWTAPVSQRFSGRFTKSGPSVKVAKFTLSLDGALRVKLDGPAHSNYDLVVSSLSQRRGSTKSAGSQDVLKWDAACRQKRTETVSVQVVRRSGAGPFTLNVTDAG
jgi:hypothetical protein